MPFRAGRENPGSILLRDKGLHIELKIDRKSPPGKENRSGLADIILESAVVTIADFEDTVIAVDVQDKINLYRNWLGLTKGGLRAQFKKNGRITDRLIAPDYRYNAAKGGAVVLPGHSLMMVRVTGPHRLSDCVFDEAGLPIPEMILDIAIAALIGLHDLKRNKQTRNSEFGSIYIVVPKLHGPEEVALAAEIFTRVEDVLGILDNVLKFGLVNEESRTSLNLAASIQAVANRIAWLGTSRFERARDEIDTAMEAGPTGSETELAVASWIKAYEAANIDTALACGFSGQAQIAQGAWNRGRTNGAAFG